jgi:hypothetical protein
MDLRQHVSHAILQIYEEMADSVNETFIEMVNYIGSCKGTVYTILRYAPCILYNLLFRPTNAQYTLTLKSVS